jgi:hypothetical protein
VTIKSPGVVQVLPAQVYGIVVEHFYFEDSKDQHTASVEAMEWAIGRLQDEIERTKKEHSSSFAAQEKK